MSESSMVRRASYGRSSPEVGVRGATTRIRITEVSLELFGRPGYFDTSVDAIAKGAGVSRAAFHQYFQGKDDIFLELLNECGSALFRVARRFGPLGPDEIGFDKLNWWLGEIPRRRDRAARNDGCASGDPARPPGDLPTVSRLSRSRTQS